MKLLILVLALAPPPRAEADGPSANFGHSRGANASRHILSLSVPEYHGSTAVEEVLMSSDNVATLCKQGCWQCEARFGKNCKDPKGKGKERTFEEALVQWSDIWDLKKPVLFLKFASGGRDDDPSYFIPHGRSPDVVTGAKLPRRLLAEGVTSLRLDIVQVWRPLCLSMLSSHFPGTPEATKKEENKIEEEARAHRAYKAAGVNVLLVSYADLLWRPEVVLKRLHAFLPDGLLDGVNFEFMPKLGRDIFPGNRWKVKGTLKSYARAHGPPSVGYDPKTRSCFDFPARWKFNASGHGAYVEATTYLQKESA